MTSQIEYYSNIDMTGNEIKNFVVDVVESLPETNLKTGRLVSKGGLVYVYTGSAWKGLAQGGDVSALTGRVTTLEGIVGLTATAGLQKKVGDLQTAVGDSSFGLVKDVSDLKTAVGNASSGLVKDVKDLQDGKVDRNGHTGHAGEFLVIGSDGSVDFGTPEAQVQASWSETDSSKASFIVGKPFKTVGTGLTVTDQGALTADTQFKFQIFQTLPTASATYAQTIALILKSATETGNLYMEYACVNTTGSTWVWEQIGETAFQLNIVQNASGITINDTALQSASASQTGLLTSTDFSTFAGKQDALTFDNAPTSGSANPVKSGGVYTALEGKVAKNADITAGTACKITYDAKGLVTAGAGLEEADIPALPIAKTTGLQNALNAKQNEITASDMLDADLVDDTDADHKFVSGTQIDSWTSHVASTANPHGVTKAQVGLGNVDNTSDLNKPISTDTQAALDLKADLETSTLADGSQTTAPFTYTFECSGTPWTAQVFNDGKVVFVDTAVSGKTITITSNSSLDGAVLHVVTKP